MSNDDSQILLADMISGQLRYSYRMQPTIFWWNLTRLGEALSELFGAGNDVDSLFDRPEFLAGASSSAEQDEIVSRAEHIINSAAAEYKDVFLTSYKLTMSRRFGFSINTEDDFKLVSECLDLMETNELDFHKFFYNLSQESLSAETMLDSMGGNFGGAGKQAAMDSMEEFLKRYQNKLHEKQVSNNQDRAHKMKQANPHFVLRSWILDEAIQKVHDGDRQILNLLIRMATEPFKSWSTEGQRYCGPVPSGGQNTMCSCSS